MQHKPSQPQEYGSAAKVAIPRLHREPEPPGKERNAKDIRVGRACLNCRRRKVKCSGTMPRCANCDSNDLECVYEQARKDRLKEAQKKNNSLIQLLKDLSLRANEEDKKRIDSALQDLSSEVSTPTSANPNALGKRPRKESPEAGHMGEAHAPASVGSNEDLDLLDEDLLASRKSRETGFVGQNSEVQWLRSLQRQIDHTEGEPYGLPYGPPGSSTQAIKERADALHERRKNLKGGPARPVADSTFYLDNDSLEVDVIVDPHETPDPEMARKLYDCYFKTVHTSFPIVPQSFSDQFLKYIDSIRQNRASHVPDKWLAILNLILAIGARYSHLTNTEWQGDERDHILFMTRAVRLLGLSETVLTLSAPDLSAIHATGLLSLYYLVIGHVSRAWVTIGISIRLALAVGLHLRNEDLKTPPAKTEMLRRTWWSLHCIECILSSITGRPCVIANEDCTNPLPQAAPSEHILYASGSSRGGSRRRTEYDTSTQPSPANSSSTSNSLSTPPASYLDAHIKISLITQNTLSGLYAARTASKSWEYMQKSIYELLGELEEWAIGAISNEHTPLNLDRDPELRRQRFLLQTYYCSTKMLITRPCLCRTDRRIKDESNQSAKFNQSMAQACVEAAVQLTSLFPDSMDLAFIYSTGPWWSIAHNIMQAMAVLLLEMSFLHPYMPIKNENILKSVKKLYRWLRAMGEKDSVSERAYQVIHNILRSCGPPFQNSAQEIISESINNNKSFGPPFTDKSHVPLPTEHWPQPMDAEFSNPMIPSFESQPTSPPTSQPYYGFQGDPNQFSSAHRVQGSPSFTNPFSTNFEQDVAILIGMQDLWNVPDPIPQDGMGLNVETPEQQQETPSSQR